MPYIRDIDKYNIENEIKTVDSAGELNYVISNICKNYMIHKGTCYQTLNEIIGVLECAKQEFYRRIVVPYEDIKIEENGDIY